LKAQSNEREMSAQECYAAFGRMGLAYGPAFQGLERVRARGDPQAQALCMRESKLPTVGGNTQGDYELHSRVVRAALQGSIRLQRIGLCCAKWAKTGLSCLVRRACA